MDNQYAPAPRQDTHPDNAGMPWQPNPGIPSPGVMPGQETSGSPAYAQPQPPSLPPAPQAPPYSDPNLSLTTPAYQQSVPADQFPPTSTTNPYPPQQSAYGFSPPPAPDSAASLQLTAPQSGWQPPSPPVSPYNPAPGTPPAPPQISPDVPTKYGVFRSIRDALQAASHNLPTLIVSIAISYAVGVGAFFLVVLLIGVVLASTSSPLSGMRLVIGFAGGFVFSTIWFTFVYALLISVISIAFSDGADGQKGSIGNTFSRALTGVKRVIAANFIFTAVAVWPLVFMTGAPLILLYNLGASALTIIALPIGLLAAIVWILIALLRFSLAPLVALFEPDVPIFKTLSRSSHLLRKGGQWFLIKWTLLWLVIFILSALVAHMSVQEIAATNNLAIDVIFIPISAIFSASLVMLYRNRRIVRGQNPS